MAKSMIRLKEIVYRLKPIIFLILVFVVWEAAVISLNLPRMKLPRPSSVFSFMAGNASYLLRHTSTTVLTAVLGFLLAMGLSIPIATGMVLSKNVEITVFPIVLVIQVVPKIAIIPIFIIWFGTGLTMKLLLVLLIAFFPLVVNTVLGLRDVNPDLVDLARSLGASRRQVFTKIRFPNSLPYLFTGMKIAIVVSLVGTIIAEFVTGNTGLGWLIVHGKAWFIIPELFAALFIAAIVGLALFWTVVLLEKKLIPWRKRAEATLGTY